MAGAGAGDELRLLRERAEALEARLAVLETGGGGVAGGVTRAAVTASGGSYPTTGAIGRVFLVQGLNVTGVTAEGGSAATATRPGTFAAACLTAGLPTAGTEVLVHQVGGAWVFRF